MAVAAVIFLATQATAEECGEPPELPYLPPIAAKATVDEARDVQQADRDYAQDIEGYLICLQLAESDIRDAARRGELRPVERGVMLEKYQGQAAEARGRETHWRDLHDRWSRTWIRAHHKPMPELPPD